MTQIGGTSDVYELANHAEKLEVSAVLCLPDYFFRPTVEEELVDYLKNIAEYCPTRPLYYYHIPQFSNVRCKSVDNIVSLRAVASAFCFCFSKSCSFL